MRRHNRRGFRRFGLGLALAASLFSTSGGAVETIFLRTPGASEQLRDDLQAASGLLAAKREGTEDAQDLFAAARAEYARLIGTLYGRGFYSPVIRVLVDGREAASIAPLDAPAQIRRIEIIVEPGPVFAFSQAEVTPLAPGTRLPERFRLGEVAESGLIRQSVTAGIDGWRALGHARAEVTDEAITANHAANTLAARIALDPGPRLRFGPLAVSGQERMSERRLRKIAGLPEGEVFDPAEVARATERLRRTGVFSSVTLTEDDRVTPPDLVGMTLQVVEQKPRRFGFGAEVATTTGLELSGFWMHRNLLGGAERLRIEGLVSNIDASDSGVDYSLGITLDRPATFTPDTTLGFGVEIARLDEADFTADLLSLETTVSHIFSPTLTGRLGIGYDYLDGRDDTGRFLYENLAFPVGLTWDLRDSTTDPTRGYFIDGEIKPFLGFGTTDSGGRLYLDARAYHGIGGTPERRDFVVAGRLQAGSIVGADILGTPRNYLFYSGGGGTVRGQPYQSLGVDIATDDGVLRTGGSVFLGGSVELRARLNDTFGVVGFLDAGQVSDGSLGDSSSEWHAGAGIGARYNTTVGPIRFDVALPVSGDTGDGVQFYIGLGQAF